MTDLPLHWGRGRMKWDTEMLAGATPSTDEESFWLDGDDPEGIPFVAIADMSRRDFVTHTAKSLSPEAIASRSMPIGKSGTLLLAMYASVGEVAFLELKATWNQALLGITPDSERVDGRFLRYVLLDMRDELLRDVRSSTQPNLNAGQVGDIWFQRPPLDEQRAIADYLDRETARIDTLIEEQQRLIEMLRERRQAVIRSSVPDPKSGSAASDKLGRHTRIGNGSTPRREEKSFWSNGHIPWLNSAVVNQDRVSAATQFVTDQAVAKCHLPLVPAGSILIALTGQGKTRGKATVLDIEATINQHMAYVVPEVEHWNSEYLLWCLRAAYGELRAVSDENGSTKGALTCEDLKQFRVAQVPLDEQRRVAAYLDEQTAKIDTLIAETETFIELARERRSALITAAVTGQIDVRKVA